MAKELWPWATVAYQIYPRSFKDSSGDGVGDLNGIREKLGYLHDLGIKAIWLSPFYPSPMADFGYDVSDYRGVDPLFGTMEDFDTLLKDAHKKGIKTIIDFVPSHTSSEHPWFLESRRSKKNPKRDWYIWRDPKPDGSPPNNWLSAFGGSAWEYDEATGQYYLHSFLKEQPDLNWYNPEVREAMKLNMRFWLKKGVDGIRLDAVNFISKDTAFADDPPNPRYKKEEGPYAKLIHTNSKDGEDIFNFLGELVSVLKEFGEHKLMITEISRTLDIVYYSRFYSNLDIKHTSPFNFGLLRIKWDAPVVKKYIDSFHTQIPKDALSVYALENHDNPRMATQLGREQARVAAMLLLTLPGMPFIYQGEELGMEDTDIPEDKMQDPSGKQDVKHSRDPVRTPMQWDSTVYAGFSKTEPWLPVGENYKEINVEAELKNPRSVLNLHKTLIKLRNSSPALQSGEYIPFESENENVFAFTREDKSGKFLIMLNFSDAEQKILAPKNAKTVLSTYLDGNSQTGVLRPNEGVILEL